MVSRRRQIFIAGCFARCVALICFPKEDFQIDLEPAPAQPVMLPTPCGPSAPGRTYLARSFQFDPAVCGYAPCGRVRGGAVRGGTHRSPASPRGALATSPTSSSEGFAEYRRLRQAAEHRLARLVQRVSVNRRGNGVAPPAGWGWYADR